MTYDKVIFDFGPYLNMVIGPNGCGKSTLICALVVGLGYPNNVISLLQHSISYETLMNEWLMNIILRVRAGSVTS